MAKKVNILIVHFNTPYLTECLVKSVNKFTPNSNIYLIDNSDKDPFTYRTDNLIYLDNTKGEIVDFKSFLEENKKYLSKTGATVNNYGTIKHSLTIHKAFDIINDDFILLDSDVLVKKDISILANEKYIYVGATSNSFHKTFRVLPFVCYINVNKCRELGVTFFNKNYIYGLEYTNNSKDYDTGGYFYLATKDIPHKIINFRDYVVHYQAGSWLSDAKKKHGYKPKYTMEQFLKNNKAYWESVKPKKPNTKVIYTCITGNYEPLDDPYEISEGYDYVCFTNNTNEIKSNVWKIMEIPDELKSLTNVKKQRCIKINAHKYLSKYDLSIWVDGSIKLTKDVNEFVKKNCSGEESVYIPTHPQRDCIYEEMKACVKQKKDIEANIAPQRKRYKEEKFPEKYGLVQSNIIIRRHNDPDCIRLMEAWWNEVKNGSHRDQLSFNYVAWKNEDVKIKYLDKKTCNSEYFQWDKSHGKGKWKPTVGTSVKKGNTAVNIDEIMQMHYLAKKPAEKPAANKIKAVKTANPVLRRHLISKSIKTFLKPY